MTDRRMGGRVLPTILIAALVQRWELTKGGGGVRAYLMFLM
jgi:hypothetical protein